MFKMRSCSDWRRRCLIFRVFQDLNGALYVLVNISTLVFLNALVVLAGVGSFANGDAGL